MELNDYQNAANETDLRPGTDEAALVFPMMGLASEVGSLVNQFKKRVRDGDAHELFTSRANEELGDVLWYLANLASKLGLTLEEVAQLNLQRTRQRWPSSEGSIAPGRLDDQFPPEERLPGRFELDFAEAMEDGRPRVRVRYEGRQVGNPLSDMAWVEDSYRYHDAFHVTYAAMLGWSPIIRAMLSKQRNSNPRYREIEDSGRAKVVEEAVAAIAFEYASHERWLDGVDHVDYTLLQTIMGMCSRFEVRIRTALDWERTIIKSFEVWRQLCDQGGGTLAVDLVERNIVVLPLAR